MYTHGWISDFLNIISYVVLYNFAAVKANGKKSRETENILTMPLGAQSRTSNRKAWFRYPASLVWKFWEM